MIDSIRGGGVAANVCRVCSGVRVGVGFLGERVSATVWIWLPVCRSGYNPPPPLSFDFAVVLTQNGWAVAQILISVSQARPRTRQTFLILVCCCSSFNYSVFIISGRYGENSPSSRVQLHNVCVRACVCVRARSHVHVCVCDRERGGTTRPFVCGHWLARGRLAEQKSTVRLLVRSEANAWKHTLSHKSKTSEYSTHIQLHRTKASVNLIKQTDLQATPWYDVQGWVGVKTPAISYLSAQQATCLSAYSW